MEKKARPKEGLKGKHKLTDEERLARFQETAREVEASESEESFDEAFTAIAHGTK